MSENRTILNIYRPVENVDRGMLARITAACMQENIRPPRLGRALYALLVGPGKLIRMYEQLQTRPGNQGIEDLGDFVLGYLPPSADETLIIPARPLTVREHKDDEASLTGPGDSTLQTERAVTGALIKAYYLDPSLSCLDFDGDYGVQVGRFKPGENHDAAAAATNFEELLSSQPDLLPSEFVLGPVDVEVIERPRSR